MPAFDRTPEHAIQRPARYRSNLSIGSAGSILSIGSAGSSEYQACPQPPSVQRGVQSSALMNPEGKQLCAGYAAHPYCTLRRMCDGATRQPIGENAREEVLQLVSWIRKP